MEVLSFEKASISKFGKVGLENIDLTIEKGQAWALLGEDSSSINLFLEFLAGDHYLSSGKVNYYFYENFLKDNEVIDPLFNKSRLISYVSLRHNFRNISNTTDFYYQQRYNSQDAENAPTVRDYLLKIESTSNFGKWNYGLIIKRLNLQYLEDKSLIMLSNGETRRLLLAAALIKNPLLLLLQHPYSGLDVNARLDFSNLLTEIIANGTTIIMSTTPKEIPDSISHILSFDGGKTREVTKPLIEINNRNQRELPDNLSNETSKSILLKLVIPPFNVIASLKNVTVKYGEKVVLEDISWEIKQGEKWALVGPNGAGKSTLLSLINGDNPQAYGNHITLFDKVRGSGESIWDIKKKIGYISPELFQYFPSADSCVEVVESGFYDTLGLLRRSEKENKEKSLEWLKVFEIDKYALEKFKDLPEDVQRLVLLARAMVKNPVLLILDEPTQSLSSHQKNALRVVIDTLCINSAITLIYVTHYQEDLPSSITHRLKLEAGKIDKVLVSNKWY